MRRSLLMLDITNKANVKFPSPSSRKPLYTIVILAIVISATVLVVFSYRPKGRVVDNVYIGSLKLSGKSTEVVQAELKAYAERRASDFLTLSFLMRDGSVQIVTPSVSELGGSFRVPETLKRVMEVGANDGMLQRVKERFVRRQRTTIKPVWDMKRTSLLHYLRKKVTGSVFKAKHDARWLIGPNGPEIRPEVVGTSLDIPKSLALVEQIVQSASSDEIKLPILTSMPHIRTSDLGEIKEVMSEFSTSYNQNGNRGTNIEVACSKINGTVLKPGDIFSYNKVVGPRESENGFKLAPVIVHGRLEPGLGGGVCQTSTTLYNAVLLSGLKVMRRSHHAFPVHYVPAGRDATVAYGAIDFRFANDLPSPIAIYASSSGGKVNMKIYGKSRIGKEIEIERHVVREWGPETQIVHDSSLPVGRRVTIESGHEGIKVNVFRKVLSKGVLVSRDLLSRDTYDPVPRVVGLGTKLSTKGREKGHVPTLAPSKTFPSANPEVNNL